MMNANSAANKPSSTSTRTALWTLTSRHLQRLTTRHHFCRFVNHAPAWDIDLHGPPAVPVRTPPEPFAQVIVSEIGIDMSRFIP
jgi:hypothetical protein